MSDPFTPRPPFEADHSLDVRRGRQLLRFRDDIEQAVGCKPLVLCLIAVGAEGSVHSVITMPDTKSFEVFEASGRLQAMANDLAAIAARSEGVNVRPGPETSNPNAEPNAEKAT
jgi:hypothetical protein